MEEEEAKETLSNLNLIWDDTEMDDIDDDIMKEACVGNDHNLRSKGAPKTNDYPFTLKMTMKMTPTTAISAKRSSEK